MKKMGCLGLLLVCGIVLSGCSNGDTTKLEKQIDKISKSVDALHERVDELSETGVDINATAANLTEKEEVIEQTNKVVGETIEHESVKVTIKEVTFLNNVHSYYDETAEAFVVITYTLENNSDENVLPRHKIYNCIYVSEEDTISEDQIDRGYRLEKYEKYKELAENAELNIKPGSKIEFAMNYPMTDASKNVNIKMSSKQFYGMSGKDEEASALQTFTSSEISKAFTKNKKIKPEE